MKLKYLILSILVIFQVHAATTDLSEDFESYTIGGGATYVNRTTLTGATVTNSVDVCKASNAFAPIGNATQFLDLVGTNGLGSVTWTLTTTAGTPYTLTYKSARPKGLEDGASFFSLGKDSGNAWPFVNLIIDGSGVHIEKNDGPQLPGVPELIAADQIVSKTEIGTYPTNRSDSITYTPTQTVWATNRWQVNTVTFTPSSTSVTITFLANGWNKAHCASTFIDDILVTH
jgi:hypothetical protein